MHGTSEWNFKPLSNSLPPLPIDNLNQQPRRQIRLRDYSISDVTCFVKAWRLAHKIERSIDETKFRQVVERHRGEGYDSYKYFDKRLWLRSKVMRAIELGLDRRKNLSVLDIGCGSGYFLYACKYLGHAVHGLDLPDREFYCNMMALFGVPRTSFRIEPYKPLPNLGRKFDVISAHQICFNGHKTDDLWGPNEWDFFINDLKTNHLTPTGLIALEFNEEPSIGFYTEQLRYFFDSLGARMNRGRVFYRSA